MTATATKPSKQTFDELLEATICDIPPAQIMIDVIVHAEANP